MDVKEVLNVILGWLGSMDVHIVTYHAESLPGARFRVAVQQVMPEQKQRTFDVVPTDVADCWNVVEATS